MKRTFSASGKLLISGEYAVLDGALALACPTKGGQHLSWEPAPSENLYWRSLDAQGKPWFEAYFSADSLELIRATDRAMAERLREIFEVILNRQPQWEFPLCGRVTSELDFDPQWGLGTSSTLISLLAQWAEIDPYELLEATFGGSGYDIACTQASGPIFYQIESSKNIRVKPAKFNPPFVDQLFFVYRNRKQNSRSAMKHYRAQEKPKGFLQEISTISQKLTSTTNLQEFRDLLQFHEELLAGVLQQIPVQKDLFPDFEGQMKSLGAWGGDFILVATPMENPKVYFQKKGYPVVIPFSEMLLM